MRPDRIEKSAYFGLAFLFALLAALFESWHRYGFLRGSAVLLGVAGLTVAVLGALYRPDPHS